MSDVIYDQLVNIFGETIPKPEVITYEGIVNSETLDFLKDKAGILDQDTVQLFLKNTPIGKSTIRILNMFSWKVQSIEIEMGDYYIVTAYMKLI